MMNKLNVLDLTGYWDDTVLISVWVHMKDGTRKYIKDIRTEIVWDDEWFTVQIMQPLNGISGMYQPGIYFRSQDVAYFEVWAMEGKDMYKEDDEG